MIRADNLCIRRGPRELIHAATFELYAGQRMGLTGENGSGKSTLLATMLGAHEADSGSLSIPPDWVIAHVAQDTPAVQRSALDFTLDGDANLRQVQARLADAVAAGDDAAQAHWHAQLDAHNAWDAEARAAQLLSGLGFEPADSDRAVADFSGGWRVRLNLARALMCPSDLLLLDEPTNHLDLDAIVFLERWLQRYAGALVLISHDREFLDATVDRVAHLQQGSLRLYTGNYSECERQRAEQDAQLAHARERQARQRAHMQAFVDRFRAKATKARQAQSRLKALAKLPDIAAAQVSSGFNFAFDTPVKLPEHLLSLHDASVGYADATTLSDLTLRIGSGDRLGLIGANGAGKSTLIKALAGVDTVQLSAGTREQHMHCDIGYFAQHQLEQLRDDQTPVQHIARLDPAAREADIRNYLGRFGFGQDSALGPVAPFSGGERARLALACVIYRAPNLLLLDEPTNHLDLMARESLALALQDFAGAVVLISHDRHLLRSCCDDFLLVDAGRCAPWLDDLDAFAQWLGQRANPRTATAHPAAGSRREERREAARRRAALQPLTKRIADIERRLEAVQSERAEVQRALADPALYSTGDSSQVAELGARDTALKAEIAELEQKWLTEQDALESLNQSVADP
ncbi:MAG: ATP-binding cassette domain-containing protein [Pseudomonadota bacterium]